jgi:hypothetical protein
VRPAHAFILNRIPGIKVTAKVRDAIDAECRMKSRPAIPLKRRGETSRSLDFTGRVELIF